jgi:formiminotetrahydrofolate cyclodeaminase
MNKFNELCESILNEGQMDKVEDIINYAGFDRGVVQVKAEHIDINGEAIKPNMSEKEVKALAKEVYDELVKKKIKVQKPESYKRFKGASYYIEYS